MTSNQQLACSHPEIPCEYSEICVYTIWWDAQQQVEQWQTHACLNNHCGWAYVCVNACSSSKWSATFVCSSQKKRSQPQETILLRWNRSQKYVVVHVVANHYLVSRSGEHYRTCDWNLSPSSFSFDVETTWIWRPPSGSGVRWPKNTVALHLRQTQMIWWYALQFCSHRCTRLMSVQMYNIKACLTTKCAAILARASSVKTYPVLFTEQYRC